MAETCSSAVHMCGRWQHQLWTLLRVGQEHPLFRKHHHQHKAFLQEFEMKWKKYTVLLPKGIVPGQLFVVSWGTILQLYHKPTKHTFVLGIYTSGEHNKFKYHATNDIKTYWKYPHLKEYRQDSNLPWDIVVQTNINARVVWHLQVQILEGTCHHDTGCKTAVGYCKCPDKAIKKYTCWRRPESESNTQASIRMFCF